MTTAQNPFQQPDKGDRFTPRDHPEWVGRLFLIYPDSVTQQMGTGPTGQPEPYESVEADVVIIDLPNPETGQPTTLTSARIGGKALVPQIKKHCGGGMVLGRLAQTAAQGSKSGAYYLADYADADVATATQYINAHPRNQFTQPAAQQQAAPAPQQQYGAPQNVTQVPGYNGPQANTPSPQYASQALPYDPWQGTQAAAQAAPAGPPAGQWGAAPAAPPAAPQSGGAPAPWQNSGQQPAPQGAPSNGAATAGPAAAAPLDPQLVAFLQSKGVDATGMSDGQARMIAQTFS